MFQNKKGVFSPIISPIKLQSVLSSTKVQTGDNKNVEKLWLSSGSKIYKKPNNPANQLGSEKNIWGSEDFLFSPNEAPSTLNYRNDRVGQISNGFQHAFSIAEEDFRPASLPSQLFDLKHYEDEKLQNIEQERLKNPLPHPPHPTPSSSITSHSSAKNNTVQFNNVLKRPFPLYKAGSANSGTILKPNVWGNKPNPLLLNSGLHSPRRTNQEEWFEQFGGIEMEGNNATSSLHTETNEWNEHSNSTPRNYNVEAMNLIGSAPSMNHLYQSSLPEYGLNQSYFENPKPTHNSNTHKHHSRIILIPNLQLLGVDRETILNLFSNHGGLVRSMSLIDQNTMLVGFFDLRHAQKAMLNLNKKINFNGTLLELQYHFLRDPVAVGKDINQGTLVIFNLDISVSNSQLTDLFGKFGEIREIRESPNKKHRFVEFYDVRCAEAAMKALNKTEFQGKKIKIEPSRPGGSNRPETNLANFGSLPTNSKSSTQPLKLSKGTMDLNAIYIPQNTEHFEDLNKSTISDRIENNLPIKNQHIIYDSNEATETKIDPEYEGFSLFKTNTNPKKKFEKLENSEIFNSSPSIFESTVSPPNSKTSNNSSMNSRRESLNRFEIDVPNLIDGTDTRTTLMVKNIPNKYDQEMLLVAVNKSHLGSYDFFYLPIDFKNKCNVGYAFINFVDPRKIPSFYNEFNNKKWEKFNSEKVCQISYARIQGKISMIDHFKNSSLMFEDPKCRPLIFHSDGSLMGKPEPFPIGSNIRPRNRKDSLPNSFNNEAFNSLSISPGKSSNIGSNYLKKDESN